MRREPPFRAILKLVEYLKDGGELKHYCEMLGNGEDGAHEHVYVHAITVLEWVSKHGGGYASVAQDFLDGANERIAEAKSETNVA